MKKIKDFVYNSSDILIAFLVLVVACGIIFWRMETILDYPSKVLGLDQRHEVVDPVSQDDPVIPGPEDPTDPTVDPTSDPTVDPNVPVNPTTTGDILENGKLTRDITIKIPKGTATEAVQPFINAGIYRDFNEFKNCCKSIGRDCNNVSGTTANLKEGMSQLEITELITFK